MSYTLNFLNNQQAEPIVWMVGKSKYVWNVSFIHTLLHSQKNSSYVYNIDSTWK